MNFWGPIFLLALAAAPAQDDRARLLILDGTSGFLTPRLASIPPGLTAQARARAGVEALLDLPAGQGAPFPAGTRVLHLFLAGGGLAVVDLSAEALKTPSGALRETLAVQSLILTIQANLPDVAKVLIMVEGRKRETLAGHLGLLEPLPALEVLVRQADSRS